MDKEKSIRNNAIAETNTTTGTGCGNSDVVGTKEAADTANRQYKDRLFNYIFGREDHKEWTLSLFNAVNGSNYTDPSEIEFNTLQDVLHLKMRNDTSFLLYEIMNVYEHQSTYNPNMPLRFLEYVVHLYSGYVVNNKYNKFGSYRIPLPVPKLVVFYNGTEKAEDELILRLTDSFPEDKRKESDIEIKVRLININYGRNAELLGSCKPLQEYSWFVSKVRELVEGGCTLDTAVNRAIETMPEGSALKGFMETHKAEVYGLLDTEYDEDRIRQSYQWDVERERKRAIDAENRADNAEHRADASDVRAEKYRAQLIAAGITPEE